MFAGGGARAAEGLPVSDSIRIRMYQAGFGDCFLLHFPTSAGTKTMLVDCGTLGGGQTAFKKVVERLLKDVDNHIDVIVATHRHRDHVSGFDHDGWKNVTATEVWMPWTERPDDAVALRIRSAQENLARSLHDTLPVKADAGLRFLAENALTNEKARDRLLQLGAGPASTLRWIACDTPGLNSFISPALPDVEVYVLGPLRDEKTFAEMEPPKEQNFARQTGIAASGSGAVAQDGGGAFPARWRVPTGPLSDEEINLIRSATPDAQFELLALNDNLINSTSIMLVLRIGEAHLLLPGDAQWSTWKAALADPARRELLTRTTFYKIGHHGSENATPIEFSTGVLRGRTNVVSMASWVKRANWTRIPEPHLVDSLRKIGHFADHETAPLEAEFTADPDGFYIEVTL
jgi:beta-lactamase superfamily II metal-dependent hydrolase